MRGIVLICVLCSVQVVADRVMTSHLCIVANLPRKCGEDQLEMVLANYERWTCCQVLDENDEKDAMDTPAAGKRTKQKHGKIGFDTAEALDAFAKDLRAKTVSLGGRCLSFKTSREETRPRKSRTLFAAHMIV